MREGRYTKTLTKIQVSTIFHVRDIRRNVVPKLPGDMVAGTNRNNCNRILQRTREFTSQGTHKQVILFLIQGLFK